MRALAVSLGLLFLFLTSSAAEILQVNYEGFTVWVDCERRGPVLFHYVAVADSGNFDRHPHYEIDTNVPARCQAKSTETFQSVITTPGIEYDVGHQVPANHFDGTANAICQTNHWTNLLPQTKSMNRGAWRQTEDIIECIRDEVLLEVWGGPTWGSNFEAPRSSLDDWIESVATVETVTGQAFDAVNKTSKPAQSWQRPNGCDIS